MTIGNHSLSLAVFGVILCITFWITYWAAKRTRNTTDFLAAGRSISALQNGFATAGDYLSASTFLGFAGLIFLYGLDGWIGLALAGASLLPIVLLLAERMRNAGKFTMADVLSFRLRQRPARAVGAVGTLAVSLLYLVAQMVGGGVLLEALAGVDYRLAVVICGALMITYVVLGGMLATTWVQIIKAGLLMTAATVLAILLLAKVNFNPFELFNRAVAQYPEGSAYLTTGQKYTNPIDGISFALALLLGSAGLPHLLMKVFTVPDARAARSSISIAVMLITGFFVVTMLIGVGARAFLGEGAVAASQGGNLTTPLLAQYLGGGVGSFGGDLFVAIISAVAFATILAVVAGLVITASGAVAHDLWTGVFRNGEADEKEELRVARGTAVALGVVAVLLGILAGSGFNLSLLIGLAFATAASANLPALLCALFWRRFNTAGAVAGVAGGLISATVLIILSPQVWPGADSQGSPIELANPAIISIPVGFLCCWLGTMLSRETTQERYDEFVVRAETGLGAA